ncbi:hypothetical protein OUZ56_000442 [Daphnia magna]|uniref:Uncharacterized protein n=1 Tax=Daphnia magna TaxID=35525 RepID=A0ABQ9ZZQ6_9CRUS|nr:hypothetical protein OUZ56_000442 [Daphnia magna]
MTCAHSVSFNYPYKALYDYRDNRTHPTDLNYLDGPVIIIIIHTPFWYTVSVGNCTWIGAEIMVPEGKLILINDSAATGIRLRFVCYRV